MMPETSNSELSPAQREQIDRLVDQFKTEFLAGRQPEIEAYLQRAPFAQHQLSRALSDLVEELRQAGEESHVSRDSEASVLNDRDEEDVDILSTQRAQTVNQKPDDLSQQQGPGEVQPEKIGRYHVHRRLGRGGFGIVYLAQDLRLDRQVAIKIPRRNRFKTADQLTAFIDEARASAKLKHPGLVPIYDVDEENGIPYIVQEFVEGHHLGQWTSEQQPSFAKLAEVFATIADALGYAHERGLTHCDLKLANVMMDGSGQPHVTDFGLSVHESQRSSRFGLRFGTPETMAPEQVRGEGHRLDGRTDIWAMGVMLYELLTGRRPFEASDRDELYDQILSLDPQPTRQINRNIPRELDRICLKCLSRRRLDRYSSAEDLSEDLCIWLDAVSSKASADTSMAEEGDATSTPDSDSGPTPKVLPKGLRSFDEHDADFFLELLPGPRDRDGLPVSIRFWKSVIENTDPAETLSVGLIYGPSGCGKSSFVKAGLLPRLGDHITSVYLEATADDTELRLKNRLLRFMPSGVSADIQLPEMLLRLRDRGIAGGQKLIIVIDQFELWLHAHDLHESTELIDALRHCDSANVQCIVIVRDDFWMATTRFMRKLEIPLFDGHNSTAIDLFPIRHAEQVLRRFGEAFSALRQELSMEHRRFLTQAVAGLADDGKVCCVRLALFAQMMREKPWTVASLRAVGGTQGIGVKFLEDTFAAPTAPPECRLRGTQARAVLRALLPPTGTDLKGHVRSHQELLDASGYAGQPAEFAELLRMLFSELRLITPIDPARDDQVDVSQSSVSPDQAKYQLTHDFLVPSLRQWLTRKQQETRQGRAELKLTEHTALCEEKYQTRYLPNVWDWLRIKLYCDSRQFSDPQRTMMRAATKYHTIRIAAATIVLFLAGLVIFEARGYTAASARVQELRSAEIREVAEIVEALESQRRWANPRLRAEFASAPPNSRERLNLALGLLPVDNNMVQVLFDDLLTTDPVTAGVVRDALYPHRQLLTERLWSIAVDEDDVSKQFAAALALATYDPSDQRWQTLGSDVADQLLQEVVANINHYPSLVEALRPVSADLVPSLRRDFRVAEVSSRRSIAASILADFVEQDPVILADLALDADPEQFRFLFPRLARFKDQAVDLFTAQLSQSTPPGGSDEEKELLAQRQANSAIGLYRFARYHEVWQTLRRRPDPRLRAYVIHRFGPLGATPQPLADRLGEESDSAILQGLLLALGEFSPDQLKIESRLEVVAKVSDLARTHQDAGIHSASQWLLDEWGYSDDAQRSTDDVQAAGNWRTTDAGYTFVVVDGREEPGIGRKFEVATKEVTVAQLQELFPDYHPYTNSAPTTDCPANLTSWYDAAAYCRRLDQMEGLSEDQMCFLPTGDSTEELKPYPDYLARTGYRLPTQAEWEFVCRAGTKTQFFFGQSQQLLDKYAWFGENSGFRLWPVGKKKPNGLGMFDMYGNAMEWCDDLVGINRALRGGSTNFRWQKISSSVREAYAPETRWYSTGFRIARTHTEE